MKIDNGRLARLEIHGVYEGDAGVSGRFLSFIPNRGDARAADARAGVLGGQMVRLVSVTKDQHGAFWTAEWEPLV